MAMGTMISDEQDTFELLVRVEAGLYMEREESNGGCDMVTREEWGGGWRAKANKRLGKGIKIARVAMLQVALPEKKGEGEGEVVNVLWLGG